MVSRTKIAGWLLVGVAALNTAIDLLNGGGFDFSLHLNDVAVALAGAGFVFLRDAVGKIEK